MKVFASICLSLILCHLGILQSFRAR
ncbi:hypothetical protein Ocin01_17483 [Orchesella cincta]|uniref:Uncharacterized protein n=1 Tax=Orchesella cincta TaxID=48709 RepID=A0A1D2M8D2_ORCCI|nr:hypothetical protein Ocin01_17483 [Orchesella cincta]